MWSYNYHFLIHGFINGVVTPVRILDWHILQISLDSIKQESSKSHQILNGQGATRYKSS